MRVIIENVRSFVGRHEIPIRPLTLLVGENSTGKTTMLALLQAASMRWDFPWRLNVNVPPYDLGDYRSIASRSARGKASASFGVGLELAGNTQRWRISSMIGWFEDRNGVPAVQALEITAADVGTMRLQMPTRDRSGRVDVTPRKGEPRVIALDRLDENAALPADWIEGNPRTVVEQVFQSDKEVGRTLYSSLGVPWIDFRSVAPIRSKPQRVYDTIRNEYSAEGDHTPYRLAALLSGKQGQQIATALEDFGGEAGLFDSIEVKRLGNAPTDPFRLLVRKGTRTATLADVGYGVGQVLPILVESLSGSAPRLLVQQPEVHLHPRAQAALATFFSRLVGHSDAQLVVETHSDYLIDRVRLEAARGTLKPEQVQILYFERDARGATAVYPIEVDEQGNLLNVPESYRAFFLEEELRFVRGGE